MKCEVTWTEREQDMPSYEVAEKSRAERAGSRTRADKGQVLMELQHQAAHACGLLDAIAAVAVPVAVEKLGGSCWPAVFVALSLAEHAL